MPSDKKASPKRKKATSKGKGTTNAKDKLRKNASRKRVPAKEKTLLRRPSEYNEAIAAEFCSRVGLGRTVRSVTGDADMPAASTIYRWLRAHPDFNTLYGEAKELHCDAVAEDTIRIADECRMGVIETTKEWGIEISKRDMIDRAKLQVDTRKWYLSKIAPKKYGEKVEQTVVNDPNKPFTITIDVKAMKVDELKGFIRDQTHGKGK